METRNPTLLGMIAGAVLVIALVAGAWAGGALTPPTQAQGSGVSGMRQITVVGQGEIRLQPDMASVQIGVETNAPTTQEALEQNNVQTQAVIERIKQLGVAEKDIQTSNFNIYASYSDDGRTISGYNVSNMVLVTVRELAGAGTLLDQVVAAGANRIYGISFGLSDPQTAQSQAREAAMADARARAEQLAGAGGASLGQVLVISELVGSGPVLPLPAMAREMVADGAATPIQAGEQLVSTQVQVTYELR